MVVTVTRRGAGNGSGTGNRGSRVGRGMGGRIPLTTFFERDKSVSTGHHPNVPLEGQPKLGILSFTGKYINENIHKKTLKVKVIARDGWPIRVVDSIGKPR
ncbi:hypothetical protein POM88_027958 [Heracleum sosnowskyi]|uniref:Uncharacterized protein n=1 Tax=Heracleum sosnowskyi TaxID=360622 RepID=A0AAD8MQN7_9APIA|nr:hypothetical protein POM88_027958 [Heracleum sosnowskyi]